MGKSHFFAFVYYFHQFFLQIFEDSIKLNTVFTYARETLEKTGQLPTPQLYCDDIDQDEDSRATTSSMQSRDSDDDSDDDDDKNDEDEKDSDDERTLRH